ncbi:DsbA family protein [Patulibacter sp. SYSU D01012]|uniref:DsbA family oxidoreductase n=1 Tax=Patulibacter sp. SYSU D01012 TaxID=2817381 RepID=UPI001B308155
MPTIELTEFTDPACPFAYSAEPLRWQLAWRFGDQLRWTIRTVGLARDADAQRAKGFDAERNAAVLRHFDRYGMPLAETDRREPAGTWDACRRIVAVREHAPGGELALLRELRFAGLADARRIDDPAVLADAAREAGLDPDVLERWAAEPATEEAFRGDLDQARDPGPVALALDHKLADVEADWDGHAGAAGRRYTCPSYVFRHGDRVAEVPGFQPWAAVETALANLAPDLERRPWPEDPADVVAWAPVPLATQEITAVLGEDDREAVRDRLRVEGVALEFPRGSDALWRAA